jgi:16S rRNA processing protein RimM
MTHAHTQIATILRAHGTAGEVAVGPEIDADLYDEGRILYAPDPVTGWMPLRILSSRRVIKGGRHQFFVIFATITTRNQAEALRGKKLHVPTDQMPDLAEEDPDLTGYRVEDADGTRIGTVLDLLDSPAHPLLEVKDDRGRFLIPFVEAYILGIDDDEGVVTVADVDALRSL